MSEKWYEIATKRLTELPHTESVALLKEELIELMKEADIHAKRQTLFLLKLAKELRE